MTTPDLERWRIVGQHLDRALDMNDQERAVWLEALHADDPDLAGELRELLDEHRMLAHERFLEDHPALPPPLPTLVGQRVGAYTIVSPIGQGGMGSVWLAARSDGRFERQAAVKFLSLALTGRGDERFRREGAIVARLSHPNIAQLLDAGVSAAGAPYLVLEHVDGEQIDWYCDRLGLDVEARVRLFLGVLSAVAHAHANLIVHRDLKPSNVLVASDGTVKLLDFGIAKLLEDEGPLGTASPLTIDGGSALTPEYAAPEQVAGGAVTTATDVYALGIMLYELLTGQHPFAAARRSAAELLKAITETDPPRLSLAASGDRLRRRLRGDLDTIVMKALKKKPADRYASVTAMAEDLRRSLEHEPIAARRDTVTYRTAKFVRRNRWAVGAATLTLAGLSIGLFAANRERLIAQQRFGQVRQLANKLFDIDVQVRQLPGNSKTRQLIVDTALDYLKRLAVDAGTDPDLAVDVGTAYMRVARVQGVPISANLGQLDEAERTLQTAQALIDSAVAARPGNRVAVLRSAQIAHDRMVLAGLKRPDTEALRYAQRSAALLEQYVTSGPVDPAEAQQVVIAYMNVANRYMLVNQLDEAIRKARRTIDIARANNQPLQAGAALMVVASALRARGDLDEALAQVQEAVRVLEPDPSERNQGRTSSYTLALTREGAILGEVRGISMGRSDEALTVLNRAAQILEERARQDQNDFDSRNRLSSAYLQSADILSTVDPPRALKTYNDDLDRLAEIKGNSKMRRDEVRALSGSAVLLHRMGRVGEARERLANAFEHLRELNLYPAATVTLGSEADEALRARAQIEADAGRVDEALEIQRHLIDAVLNGKPDVEANLSEAADLSSLYAATSAVARRAGQKPFAAAIDSRRLELWQHWDQKLARNPFVQRQLAAAQASRVD
jgi:serine/threonine protein kinase